MSIPCNKENSRYLQVCDKIAHSELIECEPNILFAHKVYGEKGEITGFDTNLTFIPNRQENKLFQLLQKSISSGQCVPDEPEQIPPQDRIQMLIFCAVFDRPWQHLKGPFERSFPYRSCADAQPINVMVRIRNLPESSSDIVMHVLDVFNVSRTPFEQMQFKPLQFGLIEIELPIHLLQKLFRNERNYIPESFRPFVEDGLALHYERTGRNEHKGPTTTWLLGMAGYFLTRFFADISNMAIRIFALEYGGIPPGHVYENDIFHQQLCFARLENGQTRLHSLNNMRTESFGLEGQWKDGAAVLQMSSPLTKKDNYWIIRSRIRQLIEAGFALESLTVANAFLEVLLKESLIGVVSKNKKAETIIGKISHRDRINLLKKIVGAKIEPGFDSEEFHAFTQSVGAIYDIRNNYVHQLERPLDDPWKIVDMERIVNTHLRFFTDPHLERITIGFLSNLRQSVHPDTVSLIMGEIQKDTFFQRILHKFLKFFRVLK